jgi:hypothetical protein
MPDTANVVAVFVNAMLPLVVFPAAKPVTVFAPFSVTPPTEVVDNVPLLANPEPLSAIVPVDVKDAVFPEAAAMVPVILILPVLLIVVLPVPVCDIPVIVSGAAVFVKPIAPPLVLVALKLVTVFASFSVAPPTDVVVSNAPLIMPAD